MANSTQNRRTARGPQDSLSRELCTAFLAMKNIDDLQAFLSDLCTPEELRSLSERWRVAKLLDQGLPDRKIQELTGVSTATIPRVARALLQGEGGYQSALQKGAKKK